MKTKSLGLLVPTFIMSVACSDVSFAPVPKPNAKAAIVSETFFSKGNGSSKMVDVLFIVDNSSSMWEEQSRLGERLGSFISSLTEANWQIGVTTTDISDGTYGLKGSLVNLDGASGYVLTKQTPNAESVFKNTVVREETIDCTSKCPSLDEQPIRAAMMAMNKRNSENNGFFRDGADLAVVVLSDEDERSDAPWNATTPNQFLRHVSSIWGDSKKVTVYGIIVVPDDYDCAVEQSVTGGRYGTYVASLSELTGGILGSICDSDYSKNLETIGKRVQELLNHVILKYDPDPDTLSIRLTPDSQIGWSLEGRKINFEQPLPLETRIEVTYKQLGWDDEEDDEDERATGGN